MATFNQWIGIGNLTRDPDVRVTTNGKSICHFGLAVNESWKDAAGTEREEVTFVDVDAFGKSAETIGKYLAKGRSIMVVGRLKLDTWETKDGEKRSKLKVVLESFQFIGAPPAKHEEGKERAP